MWLTAQPCRNGGTAGRNAYIGREAYGRQQMTMSRKIGDVLTPL